MTTPRESTSEVFDGIKQAVSKDRYAYFKDFFDNFYNPDVLGGKRISDQALQASFNVACRLRLLSYAWSTPG